MKKCILVTSLIFTILSSSAQSFVQDSSYYVLLRNTSKSKLHKGKIYTYAAGTAPRSNLEIFRYDFESGEPDNSFGTDSNFISIYRDIAGNYNFGDIIFNADTLVLFSFSESSLHISKTSLDGSFIKRDELVAERRGIDNPSYFLRDNHLEGFYAINDTLVQFTETESGILLTRDLNALTQILNKDSFSIYASKFQYYNGHYYCITRSINKPLHNTLFRTDLLFGFDTLFGSSGFLKLPLTFSREFTISSNGTDKMKLQFPYDKTTIHVNNKGSLDSSKGINGLESTYYLGQFGLKIDENKYLSFINHYHSEDKQHEWSAVLQDSNQNLITTFGSDGYWPKNVDYQRAKNRVQNSWLTKDNSIVLDISYYSGGNHSSTFKKFYLKDKVVGTTKTTLAKKPNIYPNPTNRLLKIEIPDAETFTYQIFNTQGLLVLSGFDLTDPISVHELTSGLYFISIKTPTGDYSVSRFLKN